LLGGRVPLPGLPPQPDSDPGVAIGVARELQEQVVLVHQVLADPGGRPGERHPLEPGLHRGADPLRGLSGYAGASLIGDGRMALILDVDALPGSVLRGSGLRSSLPGADR
jgi:hypothetical protein